ncbi:MAG: HDIG domain-containing protein [Bacteroidales bacterium]
MVRIFSWFRNRYLEFGRMALFLLSSVLLMLIFPHEQKFRFEYQTGKPWLYNDLIAPFDFGILKSNEELRAEEEELMASFHPYFVFDEQRTTDNRDALEQEFTTLWNQKYRDRKSVRKLRENTRSLLLSTYDTIMNRGIITAHTSIENKPDDFEIALVSGKRLIMRELSDFYRVSEVTGVIDRMLENREDVDRDMIRKLLTGRINPNIRYDPEKNETELATLRSRLVPSRGLVQAGERIISRGEVVTPEKYRVLESLRKAYDLRMGGQAQVNWVMAGQLILILVTMLSFYLFLRFFRKEVFAEPGQVVMLLVLVIGMLLLARVVTRFDMLYVYLLPVCLVPIVISVFFDSRLALFGHIITIVLIGFIVPNSYEYVFLQLFAGIFTILSSNNLERRSQFFLASLVIFITYSAIYAGMVLLKGFMLVDVEPRYLILFAVSALLTLLSYPVIYLFERIFGMTTNITLLELSNTNNKLLRELAMKAPGTFQHSMQMANLAEEAIHEIGGNALLVRTGALYHDIGKIDEPIYFIENQTTGVNPHDELTYEESAEIVVDHVLRGVERAKKYNLPEVVIDFIRTHHGTRKAEYFYRMARNDEGESVDPDGYSYPGPAPFSKETAVLMMADSVEAASRSLKKPDEESISQLVDKIIDDQMAAGQFDNADITLRDIKRIKQIFKKRLLNIYHLRIEYPAS